MNNSTFLELIKGRDSVSIPFMLKIQNALGLEIVSKDRLAQSCREYINSIFRKTQSSNNEHMRRSHLLAVLIIFALLASLLRSYSQPLIILAGVPFGAAGAFIGHFILGYNLSLYSLFGVVALAGVVVNDSLILVDRYNKFMAEGNYSAKEAVLKATQRRFRPIFLTTATTSLGLMPLIFETSTTAQFIIPLAISLAIGILFASILILFIVPTMIVIQESFMAKRSKSEKQLLAQA